MTGSPPPPGSAGMLTAGGGVEQINGELFGPVKQPALRAKIGDGNGSEEYEPPDWEEVEPAP